MEIPAENQDIKDVGRRRVVIPSLLSNRSLHIEGPALQLGTWHAAQFRRLRGGLGLTDTDLSFPPGIIITRREWRFVATVPEDTASVVGERKPVILCDIPISQTNEARGIYRIIRKIKDMANAARTEAVC